LMGEFQCSWCFFSIFYIGYRLTFCFLLNANEFKIVNCLEEKGVLWNRHGQVYIIIVYTYSMNVVR
jgi:hypothetical protein